MTRRDPAPASTSSPAMPVEHSAHAAVQASAAASPTPSSTLAFHEETVATYKITLRMLDRAAAVPSAGAGDSAKRVRTNSGDSDGYYDRIRALLPSARPRSPTYADILRGTSTSPKRARADPPTTTATAAPVLRAQSPPPANSRRAKLGDPHFSIPRDLPDAQDQDLAVVWLLEQAGAVEYATRDVWLTFVATVRANYKLPAFHSFTHAVNVTHALYALMRAAGLLGEEGLARRDAVASMVAALCHDVDHEGLSNVYHAAKDTELAAMYNGVCPMENHHAAVTSALLQSRVSPLHLLDPTTAKSLRTTITSIILATDMGKHDHLLASASTTTPWPACRDSPLVLQQVLMKCADLSNELQDPPAAALWASALMTELNNEQAALDRAPIAADEVAIARGQVGFLDAKVLPTYRALARLVGVAAVRPFMDRLEAARERYCRTVEIADGGKMDEGH
ncbi:High affinity cAMP-specific and IBMX-insensitive 3',5'-cyclic phosphodiesterase 9A [Allomyces arbusculus]|nr:High affinity cAMP-specific and IBMX-insensitive 3',5'-cyclic phosphodiesterase 9A [Allomyces arbusculus]